MPNERVLLIGLDGAPPDLIFKWADQGLLPNIAGLMAKGAYGPIRSTIPPMTCPAWTSSVTGVDVHKHGIYDFFLSVDFKRKRMTFADSRKRKSEALWSLLGASGKRSVVINLPASYPPEKLNGAMVTGMLTPSLRSQFTYPPGLRDELLGMGYRIDVGATMLEKVLLFKRNPGAYVAEVLGVLEKRLEAAKYLMKELEWDLFLVVFVALDRVNHLFWRYVDKKHVAYDRRQARIFLPLLKRCYVEVDRAVGELVKEAGPGANVIIYSDHGFRALNYFVLTNNFLRRKGFLRLTERAAVRPSITQELFLKLSWLIPPQWFAMFLQETGHLVRALGRRARGSSDVLSIFDVDPEGTLAYELGQFVHVNKELVKSEDERAEVREAVLRALKELYPLTRIMAYAREEVFGSKANELPDIVLLPKGHASARHTPTARGGVMRKYDERVNVPFLTWCGDHALYGTLIMAGPDVPAIGYFKGARIMDITPTVLKLLREEVPSYMDGRSLL